MSRFDLSRRSFLRGLGLATGALAVGRIPGLRMLGTAEAAPASAPHSVLLVYLRGGYNALFTSADSFLGNGSFGVREGNVQQVGTSRLFLDKDSLGALGPVALGGIAAIGVRHGISAHPAAQANLWMQPGGASYPVQLAKAMGGTAAIRCAAIGPMPPGIHRADGGVSLQQVRDLSTTIAALGGTTRANAPDRALAAASARPTRRRSGS